MTEFTRRGALTLAAAGLLAAAPLPTLAESDKVRLNTDADGVMLHGYDPVAYFTQDTAIEGDRTITTVHDGATYRFNSAEHREMFESNPSQYVPAYGGHCAMGTAMGLKLDVNPELFRVVDGTLYLNIHEDAQGRWLSDVSGHIDMADSKWKKIRDVPAAQLEAN
ncbi:YHS domain-containing (seleno)protein [Roseovarius salis]|uniref:YHS domain-containing (seleno)protein n=1 Tax=Roseovarius salis TaxID=3376063 RepID=UPI0037CB0440